MSNVVCQPCHVAKRKCDRKRPCGLCSKKGFESGCVDRVRYPRKARNSEGQRAQALSWRTRDVLEELLTDASDLDGTLPPGKELIQHIGARISQFGSFLEAFPENDTIQPFATNPVFRKRTTRRPRKQTAAPMPSERVESSDSDGDGGDSGQETSADEGDDDGSNDASDSSQGDGESPALTPPRSKKSASSTATAAANVAVRRDDPFAFSEEETEGEGEPSPKAATPSRRKRTAQEAGLDDGDEGSGTTRDGERDAAHADAHADAHAVTDWLQMRVGPKLFSEYVKNSAKLALGFIMQEYMQHIVNSIQDYKMPQIPVEGQESALDEEEESL